MTKFINKLKYILNIPEKRNSNLSNYLISYNIKKTTYNR